MDKSLDQVIKENPRKFSLNKGRNQNRETKGAVGKAAAMAAKKNQARLGKKASNQGGRPIKTPVQGVAGSGGRVLDARNKLLAKNRLKIKDARDKLADLTKKTTSDLRLKLVSKRPAVPVAQLMALKLKTANQRSQKLVRNLGPGGAPAGALTRTIISRTVQNEFARQQQQFVATGLPAHHYGVVPMEPPRYQPPMPVPTRQYYHPYPDPPPAISMKHSTAAMDMEPLPSATKRIRPIADKRLGSRDEPKHLPDAGHRVYVDNLHPKVTQEDIFELFGDIGQLSKATLQRPGMAEVVYARREDAMRAVDVYHNRQLDGLPMHCTLAAHFDGRQENAAPIKTRAAGGKPSNVAPDIHTIHKALFNKTSSNAQIFTVTLPKKT